MKLRKPCCVLQQSLCRYSLFAVPAPRCRTPVPRLPPASRRCGDWDQTHTPPPGDAAKEKIAELEDRVKRQLAEFENFRNRTEKEKQAMFETGAKCVIEKILPVIDNFERGLATVPEDQQGDAFVSCWSFLSQYL